MRAKWDPGNCRRALDLQHTPKSPMLKILDLSWLQLLEGGGGGCRWYVFLEGQALHSMHYPWPLPPPLLVLIPLLRSFVCSATGPLHDACPPPLWAINRGHGDHSLKPSESVSQGNLFSASG